MAPGQQLPERPYNPAGPSRRPQSYQQPIQHAAPGYNTPIIPFYPQNLPAAPLHYPYQMSSVAYSGYKPTRDTSGGYMGYGNGGTQPLPDWTMQASNPIFSQTATSEGYSYSGTYLNQRAPAGRRGPGTAQATVISAAPTFKAWRNCSQPGCKFVGSGEDVELHESDRHLIYPKGYVAERSEEEERYAKNKGPAPPVFGTNITLQTEEDIAKWIAERKAKWPSAKRKREKAEEEQAAIERGEVPSRGRGRGRGRGGTSRRGDAASLAEDWGRPDQMSEHDGSRGARGRGQARGRGRGDFRGRVEVRGRGRQTQTGHDVTPQGSAMESQAIVTTGTVTNTETAAGDRAAKQDPPENKLDLGYESAESASCSSASGSDAEVDDSHTIAQTKPIPEQPNMSGTDKGRPLCKFFARHGKCKHGKRCKFLHETGIPEQDAHRNQPERKEPNKKQLSTRVSNPFERPSMLGALLANPIQNTISQLSQTIRFLVANDMLEGVELWAGQAEEMKRKIEPISPLPTEPTQ